MRLLLDTHALLWLLTDDPRLGPQARAALLQPETHRVVSTVSLWEVALKAARAKLPIGAVEVAAAVVPSGLMWLPLQPDHVAALTRLPQPNAHRDPFDRMLLAQALAEGLTLLTADRALGAYGVPILACGA